MQARWLDLVVVLVYVLGLTGVGWRFAHRQTTTERYFTARRSVPSWAIGLSFLAAIMTSLTFIGYPGSAYSKDWSQLVPNFFVLVALVIVGIVVIPFYRRTVGTSAFEYFGKRFGPFTRMYASIAFSLAHFSKMALVFYLLALTINSMTGWNMDQVILIAGLLTVSYTLKGGFEAVVWTDVVQSVVIWVGIAVCLGYLLFVPPGGPAAAFSLALRHHRFSLGSTAPDLSKPTLWVMMIYGFFWYLQRYTTDQVLVQRYLAAKSDRAALRGIALGSCLAIPVWTLFMLIGSCTWTFFQLTGEKLPAHITKADEVFPYFISTHLPPGMAGLFMAALIGAAMCALSSDLNAFASVGVTDFYRQFRPDSSDRQRLKMGKLIVCVSGILAITAALILSHTNSGALSLWYTLSAIVSGGLAGLFLLAFLDRRATHVHSYAGIAACVVFTTWATLTEGAKPMLNLGRFNFPWHNYMIGAIGSVVLLGVGFLSSRIGYPAGSAARTAEQQGAGR